MRIRTRSSIDLATFAVVGALLVVLAASLTSCGDNRDPYQTQVVTDVTEANTVTTITPIERGKIRREVERVAQGGMTAWLADDIAAMSDYFSDEYVTQFKEQAASYAAEGKVRVRSHSEVQSGVTEIGGNGKQALVEYNFTDDSYFADSSGKQLTEPEHKPTVFQLTLENTDAGWRIIRIIGRLDSLQ